MRQLGRTAKSGRQPRSDPCPERLSDGRFLGSGGWESVLEEGGLSGAAQFEAVRAWAKLVG